MKNKKKAFTMSEILLMLAVIAAMIAIMMPVILDTTEENLQRLQAQKIHNSIKTVVDTLLNNSSHYAKENDFSSIASDTLSAQTRKFMNAFKSLLVAPQVTQCPVYNPKSNTVENSYSCFTGSDDITWGFVDNATDIGTDFVKEGVVFIKTQNGYNVPYAPITVYASYKKEISDKNPQMYWEQNAILYGVRKDGHLIFLNQVFDDYKDEDAFHYKAQKFLTEE